MLLFLPVNRFRLSTLITVPHNGNVFTFLCHPCILMYYILYSIGLGPICLCITFLNKLISNVTVILIASDLMANMSVYGEEKIQLAEIFQHCTIPRQ